MELPEELDARHGDLVISRRTIPEEIASKLTKPSAPIVLAGQDSAPHQINEFSAVEHVEIDGVHWLRLSRDVELSHAGRHISITMLAGDNEVYPLTEMDGAMARNVVD